MLRLHATARVARRVATFAVHTPAPAVDSTRLRCSLRGGEGIARASGMAGRPPYALQWITASSRALSSGVSNSGWEPAVVYVQVGASGTYTDWAIKWEMLKDLRAGALLGLLATDPVFGPDLKGIQITACGISIRTGDALGDAATSPAAAAEVKLDETIGSKIGVSTPSVGSDLFIDVNLPPDVAARRATAAAPLREDATADEMYALLPAAARAAVDAARAYRGSLAGVPALRELTSDLTAAEAAALGIEVLRSDADGKMVVGMFAVPALNLNTSKVPRTFEPFAHQAQMMLLLPQHLQYVREAVKAVQTGSHLGIHLSGPNGVGKTAILQLLHLILTALGIPSVYLPFCEALVNAAAQERGDAFILEAFWEQNADLIIGNAALRRVFEEALLGVKDPFTPTVMDNLRIAVGKPGLRGVAVIMDEVQHITKAVAQGAKPTSSTGAIAAATYLTNNWYDWGNDNRVFQRVSAASAHSHRETNYPDGEQHRLRFVEPLRPEDREVVQASPASPAYVHDPDTREYVALIAGNVLQRLVQASTLLPRDRKPAAADLANMWLTMLAEMRRSCSAWLASLPAKAREEAVHNVMSILKGEVVWGDAMALYDTGIVYRSTSSPLIAPVSAAASAALLRVAALQAREMRVQLSTLADDSLRGAELERQVLDSIDVFLGTRGVPCKLLDGTVAESFAMPCKYSLPFKTLSEVVAHDEPVLYRPVDLTYTCDGILMPAASDSSGAVHVIECSTTDPTESGRVQKVGGFFKPDGVVTALKASNTGREVVVALFYDGRLPVRAGTSAGIVDISNGLVPPPPSKRAGAAADGATSGGSASAATTLRAAGKKAGSGNKPGKATGGHDTGRKSSGQRVAPSPFPALGNAVRVVDASGLVRPLGVLV